MFYKVSIGITTKRGHFQEQVSKVVEYDGTVDSLYLLLSNKYNGFTVNMSQVEKIEKVEEVEANKKETPGETIVTNSCEGEHYLRNKQYIQLQDYIDEKLLDDLNNAYKEIAELENKIKDIVGKKLKERIEVRKVVFGSIQHGYYNRSIEATIYINGHLWKV